MVELVFTKRTQASIYSFVTVGFARNSTYGIFSYHVMLPLCVQFLMNVRNLFRFSSSIYKVIWWNKRECVTVTKTKDIFIWSKWFIYRLSLKFGECMSSGKFYVSVYLCL